MTLTNSTSHAASDTPIKIGVIGCGGRGTGAVLDAIGAATQVIYPQAGYQIHLNLVLEKNPAEHAE